MADINLERRAMEAFARDEVRDRLVYFAERPKRRRDLLDALHTSEFLAPTACVPLPRASIVGARDLALAALVEHMSKLGLGRTCYAISLLSVLDGQSLPLARALEECFMNTVETLLFDPVSRLGYLEGGHPNDRFILRAARPNAL